MSDTGTRYIIIDDKPSVTECPECGRMSFYTFTLKSLSGVGAGDMESTIGRCFECNPQGGQVSELRDRIAAKILDNFNPPDDKHPSWWINPEVSAQAIIDEFELTTNGEHGYVEIWGCYDTKFEEDK